MHDIDLDCVGFAVLDTETSGLTRNDVVIQCAIGFYDSDGHSLFIYNKYWQLPAGLLINSRAQEVHQITPKDLETKGVSAHVELCELKTVFQNLKTRAIPIVAHNARFDSRMLRQTATIHGVIDWHLQHEDLFCTMTSAKSHVGALNRSGKLKAPSNSECYEFLFGVDASTVGPLHDANTCV